ncbi:hypothetical protein Ga0609869_002023 [Rhodovulum iodosum]|uniref:Uncharacterized protein n=1 Tax=Rhodovulum iodosum TaxID=68291 RepID=A0ABV3XTK4_9RHOB|nr:hypothetical protein [Rhodovulum robiginosum]RSK32120.1 hypothetical protein EJA01_12895 [Rhodovulum robiginosum]
MLKPETELPINRLSNALRTSFEWIVKRDRESPIGDIAEAWAELTASALQDVRLMAPPMVDHTEPFLPFIETHRIKTDRFRVARSGMRGGPTRILTGRRLRRFDVSQPQDSGGRASQGQPR